MTKAELEEENEILKQRVNELDDQLKAAAAGQETLGGRIGELTTERDEARGEANELRDTTARLETLSEADGRSIVSDDEADPALPSVKRRGEKTMPAYAPQS